MCFDGGSLYVLWTRPLGANNFCLPWVKKYGCTMMGLAPRHDSLLDLLPFGTEFGTPMQIFFILFTSRHHIKLLLHTIAETKLKPGWWGSTIQGTNNIA